MSRSPLRRATSRLRRLGRRVAGARDLDLGAHAADRSPMFALAGAASFWLVAGVGASAIVTVFLFVRVSSFPVVYLSLLAAVLYFVARLWFVRLYGLTVTRAELTLAALVALCTIAIVLHDLRGLSLDDFAGRNSAAYTEALWANALIYLFAGASVSTYHARRSNIVAVLLMLVVVVPTVAATRGELFVDYTHIRYTTGEMAISHLTIAEWAVYLCFAAYAFASRHLRPLIVIVSFCCLFAMQGRSSTAFTLFAFLAVGFAANGWREARTLAIIALLVGIGTLFVPLQQMFGGVDEASLERMTLSTEGGDLSAIGRSQILLSGLKDLPDMALHGDPTYLAREWLDMGSYMHNLLSLWQFFGALPFFLCVIILVQCAVRAGKAIRGRDPTPMEEFGALLVVYVLVSVVFSKSILFYWLWFVMGFWMLRYDRRSHALRRRRRRGRRSNDVLATLKRRTARAARTARDAS